MRLYLASYHIGNRPDELVGLLRDGIRVGVVSNAVDGYDDPVRRAVSLGHDMDELRGLGLDPTEIDLRDFFGRSSELKARLTELDLLYVRGGNTFVLRRAFRQSGADDALIEMLANDTIAYAGFSAGICLLAPTLRGLELVDEPGVVPAEYEAEVLWDGLGLVPYHIIPHYNSDHPESESMNLLVTHWVDKHVLFIALKDGEAIIIDGERQTLVG